MWTDNVNRAGNDGQSTDNVCSKLGFVQSHRWITGGFVRLMLITLQRKLWFRASSKFSCTLFMFGKKSNERWVFQRRVSIGVYTNTVKSSVTATFYKSHCHFFILADSPYIHSYFSLSTMTTSLHSCAIYVFFALSMSYFTTKAHYLHQLDIYVVVWPKSFLV